MRVAFEYATVRVVPDVAREEFVNVGVVVVCARRDLIRAAFDVDEARLLSFAPGVDLELVRSQLDAIVTVCSGAPSAGAVGALPIRERFGWLVAPRSTMIQTSAPHGGLTFDIDQVTEHLLATMVRAPRPRQA